MHPRQRTAVKRPRRLVALASLATSALLIGAGSVTLTGGVSAAVPAPAGALPVGLQRQLQRTLDATMAEYGVPGAAVGVWIPGQGAWTSATGLADIESSTPTSTDMAWPLRSITKSYTVTLLLQLVDDVAFDVDLDDTIDQYVDGVTNGDTITLRELANMSSGNADYTNAAFGAAYDADPNRIFSLAELNGFMLGEPAQFAPGTEHVYTNANTNLLGAVVEKVTGDPFEKVLNERILQPLNLSKTHYIVDVNNWAQPHPSGYSPDDAGAPQSQPQNLSIFGPAGSMVTTLDDARVWGEALATGALLAPATQAERLQGTPLDAGPPYDLYALGIGETNGWWGHNGEGLGFTAAVFHDPDSGATIAVFMNKSDVVPKAHPADQTFRRFAEILGSSPFGSSSLGSSSFGLPSLGLPSLGSS